MAVNSSRTRAPRSLRHRIACFRIFIDWKAARSRQYDYQTRFRLARAHCPVDVDVLEHHFPRLAVQLSSGEKAAWKKSSLVINNVRLYSSQTLYSTVRQPGFDLPGSSWSLFNCFRTGRAGVCASACLATSSLRVVHVRPWTTFPLTKLKGYPHTPWGGWWWWSDPVAGADSDYSSREVKWRWLIVSSRRCKPLLPGPEICVLRNFIFIHSSHAHCPVQRHIEAPAGSRSPALQFRKYRQI